MEEVLKQIKNAEERAAEIKAAALDECAVIAERAEKRAAEILKTSDGQLKLFKEESLLKAEKEAQKNYENEIEKVKAEAKNYADGIIKNTGEVVGEIVGRILGGNG